MDCGCEKDKKKDIKKAGGDCCPAPVIEIKNPEEVVMFHKVIVPVALGDEATFPAVKGLYKNVLMVYESNGHAYLYSSDGIPSYISFDTGGVLVVSTLPEASQATENFIYVTRSGASYITMDGENWVTLSTGEFIDFDAVANRPKYAGQEMTSETNIPSVEEETAARIAADNSLRSSLQSEINNRAAADTAISQSLSSETTARTAADTTLQSNINAEAAVRSATDDSLQDQIDEVDSVASTAIQPEDIDIDVVTNIEVDQNTSTTVVQLDAGKTNLMTKTQTTSNIPLPVANSTQAGVMNSATYNAITQNTNDISILKNEVVAVTGLAADPTQEQLTAAWGTETGLTELVNGASIYDVSNEKVWTYYTNDTTWHGVDAHGSVQVSNFTNSQAGIIQGSTNIGQVFAENDGTGSVNGWDALSSQVGTNASKLATIASGAGVNVQSDWANTNSTSDAFIKNKPTFKTINGTSITGSGNIQTGDMLKSTYDTNDNGIVDNSEKVNNHTVEDDVPEDFFSGDATVYGTGTSITLNNTANVPLDDAKMLGDTEQDGTPTPDAPIPIETVTGLQTVTISDGGSSQRTVEVNLGKNLYEGPPIGASATEYGLTGVVESDGRIHVTGTAAGSYITPIRNQALSTPIRAGDYTFSVVTTGESAPVRVEILLYGKTGAQVGSARQLPTESSKAFTISEDAYAIRIAATALTSGTTYDFYIQDFQIERGNLYSGYSPYFEPIELCKIGDYQDYIYQGSGKWYLHKGTGKVVLDGSETYVASTAGGLRRFQTTISGAISSSGRTVIMSDYFRYGSGDEVGACFLSGGGIYLYPDASITTVPAWADWLASNNTTVIYPLATPTDTEITNAEILSGLEELIDTQTPEGTTIITVSGTLPAILEVTARTDTVAGIEKAIDGVDDDLDRAAFVGNEAPELEIGQADKVTQLTDRDRQPIYPIAGGATENAISTAMLRDEAITTTKIGSDAVTEAKLGGGVFSAITIKGSNTAFTGKHIRVPLSTTSAQVGTSSKLVHDGTNYTITIGAGVSTVLISAFIYVSIAWNSQHAYAIVRKNETKVADGITSTPTSGAGGIAIPPFLLPVSEGDVIDLYLDAAGDIDENIRVDATRSNLTIQALPKTS